MHAQVCASIQSFAANLTDIATHAGFAVATAFAAVVDSAAASAEIVLAPASADSACCESMIETCTKQR
jgi:hypothetical protein